MRKPDFDILIMCDMCVDLIVTGDDVVPEFGQVEKLVGGYTVEMGGSCAIFACQAAKLGLKVAAVGRVGQDGFGELVMRRLREAGVDTRHVEIDPGLQTGMGIALCQKGDRAILTYPGSICAVRPETITDELLLSAAHLHHGSYYLQQQLRAFLPDIFERAHRLGLTTSLDTNWDPEERWRDSLLENLLVHTDVFLPNEQEAMHITGLREIDPMVEALHRMGPATITMKRGELGALVDTGGRRDIQAVEPVTGGDSIGAGDSFDAGFLYGWLKGHAPAECLRIANLCGRSVAAAIGGLAGQPAFHQIYTAHGRSLSFRA